MMGDLIHWTLVPLAMACGRGEYDIDVGDNAERRRYLTEYRDTGCIDGVFLAWLEDMEDEHADAATLGPSVAEIDWTGL